MKSRIVTIQMIAIDQYFPVELFVMLYNVARISQSVDEIAVIIEIKGKKKTSKHHFNLYLS